MCCQCSEVGEAALICGLSIDMYPLSLLHNLTSPCYNSPSTNHLTSHSYLFPSPSASSSSSYLLTSSNLTTKYNTAHYSTTPSQAAQPLPPHPPAKHSKRQAITISIRNVKPFSQDNSKNLKRISRRSLETSDAETGLD